jgi:hypothetical protein
VAFKRKETNEFQCIHSEGTKVHAGSDVAQLHKVRVPSCPAGVVRKVGYRRKDETMNRVGHIANRYLECANFVQHWKTGATKEGNGAVQMRHS